MKVMIRSSDSRSGHALTLHFPLWGLSFALRIAIHYQGKDTVDIDPALIRQMAKALAKYRKTNGPFDLVHILSADGDEVLIRI